MASWGRCDFSEFEKFAKQFEKISQAQRDEIYATCCKALAARLLALVIPETPIGQYPKKSGKKGGTLQRGWGPKNADAAMFYAQSLPVTKKGNTYVIEIVNPVEYASYVEYGHRTVNGGFVEGKRMLEVSVENLKKVAPAVLEKIILNKLKEFFDG